MTTWDNQITTYNGMLGSINEVKALIRSAVNLTGDKANADLIIQSAMTTCKGDLKERIILQAAEIFPDSIAMYKGIWERAQTKLFSVMYPSGFPSFGYVSIFGTFIDTTTSGYTDTPYVYVNYGVPTAGLFSGSAVNGAFCWNTLAQTMYINRGSLAAPSWDLFDASELINYITNPLVLHTAFLYGTGYYFFENVITNFLSSAMAHSMAIYQEQEARFYDKYEMYAKRALSQLDMDISNGGTITSLDTKFQRAKQWAAV